MAEVATTSLIPVGQSVSSGGNALNIGPSLTEKIRVLACPLRDFRRADDADGKGIMDVLRAPRAEH